MFLTLLYSSRAFFYCMMHRNLREPHVFRLKTFSYVITLSLVTMFTPRAALAFAHHRTVSANIYIRNNTSSPLFYHGCNAYKQEHRINRCYFIAAQGEDIPSNNMLLFLGEAHNKNSPAEGHFRMVMATYNTTFDIKYVFPTDGSMPEIWLENAKRKVSPLPVTTEEQLHHQSNDTEPYCSVKKRTRVYLKKMRRDTSYHYECTLSLIDKPSI